MLLLTDDEPLDNWRPLGEVARTVLEKLALARQQFPRIKERALPLRQLPGPGRKADRENSLFTGAPAPFQSTPETIRRRNSAAPSTDYVAG